MSNARFTDDFGNDVRERARKVFEDTLHPGSFQSRRIVRTKEGKVMTSHTFRRQERKIGRNDPCPCGSGLKFKKCHGFLPTTPAA